MILISDNERGEKTGRHDGEVVERNDDPVKECLSVNFDAIKNLNRLTYASSEW